MIAAAEAAEDGTSNGDALRDTLNWLRDQLIPIYEEAGRKLFADPWAAEMNI